MNINQLNTHYFSAITWLLAQSKIEYYRNETIVRRGGRSINYGLRLKNPLDITRMFKLSNPIALACESQGVVIHRRRGCLAIQIALPEDLWLQYYRGKDVDGLGIGMTDSKKVVEYNFNSSSSLIAATTGGGKSFCGFASLLALCDYFTPDELQIVLVDPHRYFDEYKSPDGGEQYVTFRNESHILRFDYGSCAYGDADIQTAIDYVHNESRHRLQNQIIDAGHLLLVIDESDSVLQNPKLLNKVQFIAKQTRKVNVHLMILSQEPTKANIPIRDLLGNRFIGKQEMRQTEITNLIGIPVDARNLTIGGHDFFHVESGNIDRFTVVKLRECDFAQLERGNQKLVDNIESTNQVKSVGRPKKPLNQKLLSYLWLVGPDTYSNSLLAKHFCMYHERIQYHKDWIRQFGANYMKLRQIKKGCNDLHPKFYC